jgi:2,4-dienoyl-CoA reductase-like NADH-dependent reductase (Old Yellow Enzyme family)/thioredoxin reductase
LIFSGFTFIDDRVSRSGPNQMGVFSDDLIPGLRKLAQAVENEGAKFFLQLVHGGRQASVDMYGERRLAPSAVGTDAIPAPTELTTEQIKEIIEAFAQAARRAREAGFSGVEMHGAHGYLMAEFMSDFTNRRDDEWGGDFERRMHFPLAVLARIKEVCGADYPVGIRFSADEYLGLMDEKLAGEGITLPVSQRIAKTMQEAGVTHLSVSACLGETAFTAIQPLYLARGFNLHLSKAIRDIATVPVIAAGSITQPEMAEEAIATGKADMVAMGRALIADPGWANSAREGRTEDIRPCIRCCECTVPREEDPKTRCAVNVEVGREQLGFRQTVEKPKRVLVVGGGPAGMEAALRAAWAGHTVLLCEKENYLGGYLRPGSAPEFKSDIRRLLEYYPRQLKKAGVDVQLGCPFDEALATEVEADVIILALGSTPALPKIPGADGNNVHQAVDVLNGAAEIEGETVVVIGGGGVGCETSLFLAQNGKKVTVLEMLPEILADEDAFLNKVVLTRLLKEQNVSTVVNAKVTAIHSNEVKALVKEEERSFPTEEVVLAVGMMPAEQPQLSGMQAEIIRIGDGQPPKRIFEAVHAGAEAALSIS